MSVSEVSICNSALLKIGANIISSLNEAHKRAILCKEFYPKVRDEVLRSHPWNFATKRVALALLPDTPIFKYTYQFQLPTDRLRILEIDPKIEYKVEGNKLLCDADAVSIRYIFRETNTTNYDSSFVEALALRMAVELAYPLVQSVNLKQQLYGEYQKAIQDARTYDSQEDTPDQLHEDYFLNARFFGDPYDQIQ